MPQPDSPLCTSIKKLSDDRSPGMRNRFDQAEERRLVNGKNDNRVE